MKKRIFSVLLAAAMCVTACGCGGSSSQSKTGHYDFFYDDGAYKLVYNGEIMDAEIESGYPTSSFYNRTASADMNTIAFNSCNMESATLYAAYNGKVTEITDNSSMNSEIVSLDGRYILYLVPDEDDEKWSLDIYDCKEDKATTVLDKLPLSLGFGGRSSAYTSYVFSQNGKYAAIAVASLRSARAGIYLYDIAKDELTKICDLDDEEDYRWVQYAAGVSNDGNTIVTYGMKTVTVFKDGEKVKGFDETSGLIVNAACTEIIVADGSDTVFYGITDDSRKKLKIGSDGDNRLRPLSPAQDICMAQNAKYYFSVNSGSLFDTFYTTSTDIIYIDADGNVEAVTEGNNPEIRNYDYCILCEETKTVYYTYYYLYRFSAGDSSPTEIGFSESFGVTADGKSCYYTDSGGELYFYNGSESELVDYRACTQAYMNGLEKIGEISVIIGNSILYYNTAEECYYFFNGNTKKELDLSDYSFMNHPPVISGGFREYQLAFSKNYNVYPRYKDYLFLTDKDGNTYLLDATGNITGIS